MAEVDLTKVVELSYTRLANLLLDGGCPNEKISKCDKIEDLYRLAPFFLTKKPSTEADAIVLLRKWIGRADPASTDNLDLIFFLRANENDVHKAYTAWAQWVAWRVEYGPEIAMQMRTDGHYDSPIQQTSWNTFYTAQRCDKCLQYHSKTLGTPRACREGKTSKELFEEQVEAATNMSAYERANATTLASDINFRTISANQIKDKKQLLWQEQDEEAAIAQSKALVEIPMVQPVLKAASRGRWGPRKNSEKRQPRKTSVK